MNSPTKTRKREVGLPRERQELAGIKLRSLVVAVIIATAALQPASAQIANKPLFVSGPGLPPNILLILDSSESMQEGVNGRIALDTSNPLCIPGPNIDPNSCPAGARSPLSKGSIVKRVGLSLVDEYKDRVNMGLLSYQQNPASVVRNSFNSGGTVRWHLVERAIDVRFSTNANPSWWQPNHTQPWDSDIKRYRERHPTRDNIWMFFNDAIPGYAWSNSDPNTGTPNLATNVTGFYCRTDTTSTSAANACTFNTNFVHDPLFTRMTSFFDLRPNSGAVQDNIPGIGSNLWFNDRENYWQVFLVDSQRQRNITSWGRRAVFTQLNQLEWRSTTSPGRGYLHQPIRPLDDQHAAAISAKLQPQRVDWNGSNPANPMIDPTWPLIASGLTPLEGTMQTARDYFLGSGGSSSTTFGPNQGWRNNLPPIPESCDVNAAIWVTDGLPSVAADGTALGTDLPQALNQARDAVADFYGTAGVRTYIVGFALPPGVANIPNIPSSPLNLLAAAGGTGQAFDAQDEGSLLSTLDSIFDEILAEASGSAAALATSTTSLDTGGAVFRAGFDTRGWFGELEAFRTVAPSGPNQSVLAETPDWKASQRLPSAANRNIFTWTPPPPNSQTGSTVPFSFGELSSSQQDFLNAGDGRGAERLAWLRGDKSNEGTTPSSFRVRQNLLGDIVNSQPLFVSKDNFGYQNFSTGGSSYQSFVDSQDNKTLMVLVAANDGKLHAFDGRVSCPPGGQSSPTGCSNSGGVELFAYVPNAVFPRLAALTDPQYDRRYVLDGSPQLGHVYDLANMKWRRVVVGSLGAGGRGVYALDIDSQEVLWERTSADFPQLGYVIGHPVLGKAASGEWVTIIPNGATNTNGQASIIVVDTLTGEEITTWTPASPANQVGSDNGMFTPVPVDINGDRMIDRIYAGDLNGNLWRFDFSGNQPSQWGVPGFLKSGSQDVPLFQARNDSGDVQPITVRPAVILDRTKNQLMVLFGTGKFFEVDDNNLNSAVVQSFYGIYDADQTVSRADLLKQEILHEVVEFGFQLRVTTDKDMTTEKGWHIDLVSPNNSFEGERVIYRALIRPGGRVVFSTLIPSVNTPGSPGYNPCAPSDGTGWLMEMNAFTGSRLTRSPWDLSGLGFGEESFVTIPVNGELVKVPVSGIKSPSGVPSAPAILEGDDDREYKLPVGSSGEVWQLPDEERIGAGRQTWRQIR